MFSINFIYTVWNLLPVSLRKPKLAAFLRLCLSYVEKIYLSFVEYRAAKSYMLNFTGQVMYLEQYLRDSFLIPGISISDGNVKDLFYLFNESEGFLPVYINNEAEPGANLVELWNISEITENVDFYVNVPIAAFSLLTDESLKKMQKMINYFLVYGKNYIIRGV